MFLKIVIHYHDIKNNVFGGLWCNHEMTNNVLGDYGVIMK
jgi:hypothetical protein